VWARERKKKEIAKTIRGKLKARGKVSLLIPSGTYNFWGKGGGGKNWGEGRREESLLFGS